MNIFFHGTIEAGFNAIKGKLEKDMAGPMGQWITEYRLADLGNNEVMCAMNCTDMEALGAFMSDPAEMQWDKDNGAVYKADNWEMIGETAGLPEHKSSSMKWHNKEELKELAARKAIGKRRQLFR